MTIEIDGKKMKQCPGWSGNKGRCGRGNPRLIPETAEVCENCSRGMRKAGQKLREEEEQDARARAKRVQDAERGAKVILERAGVTLTDEERAKFAKLLEARDSLRAGDVEGKAADSYYYRDSIYGPAREDSLLVAVGLPVPDETTGRRRR